MSNRRGQPHSRSRINSYRTERNKEVEIIDQNVLETLDLDQETYDIWVQHSHSHGGLGARARPPPRAAYAKYSRGSGVGGYTRLE